MAKRGRPRKKVEPKNVRPLFEKREQLKSEEEELIQRVSRCDVVINAIQSNSDWRIVLDDLAKERQRIDDSWHLTTNGNLEELRVTKMAVMYLVNLIQVYEKDKEHAMKRLKEVREPDNYASGYYDPH